MAAESESKQYCILLCALLSVLITYVLRSTKVFKTVTGAGYYDKLQGILTTAAPELDKALQKLERRRRCAFYALLVRRGI